MYFQLLCLTLFLILATNLSPANVKEKFRAIAAIEDPVVIPNSIKTARLINPLITNKYTHTQLYHIHRLQ